MRTKAAALSVSVAAGLCAVAWAAPALAWSGYSGAYQQPYGDSYFAEPYYNDMMMYGMYGNNYYHNPMPQNYYPNSYYQMPAYYPSYYYPTGYNPLQYTFMSGYYGTCNGQPCGGAFSPNSSGFGGFYFP